MTQTSQSGRSPAADRPRGRSRVNVDRGGDERDPEHEHADRTGQQAGAKVLSGQLAVHMRRSYSLTSSTIAANSSARYAIENRYSRSAARRVAERHSASEPPTKASPSAIEQTR